MSKRSNKHARRGKKQNHNIKRELILKDDSQVYAQVVKMLGNCRLEAFCFDGKTRLCIIRGKLKKRCRIRKNDIILLSLRDFQDYKADVIHKYNDEDIQKLHEKKELPIMQLKNDVLEEYDECPFSFL